LEISLNIDSHQKEGIGFLFQIITF